MIREIEFLNGKVALHPGDCLDALRALPDSSIDSCVTDPPYALASIVKRFDGKSALAGIPFLAHEAARRTAINAFFCG